MKRMPIEITVLADNSSGGKGLLSEHGLAVWIKAGSRQLLFDTGQGKVLVSNAEKLKIRLDEAGSLVLSHGHYDHTGGVPGVLEQAPGIEIYCHPGVFQPRYSVSNGLARPIHLQKESMAAIHRHPERRMHWVSSPYVFPSAAIGLTGAVPRETSYEDVGGHFFLDPEAQRPDPIEDDQALWIQTPEGLILLVGCCHAGLVNTIHYATRLAGTNRVRAILGGLHLVNAGDERLERTVAELKRFSPDLVVPCHCTGLRALQMLKAELGAGRVSPGYAGAVHTFSDGPG